MKFSILEVYSDGAVIEGSNGRPFGLAVAHLNAMAKSFPAIASGERQPIKTLAIKYTEGNPHPMAMLLGLVDVVDADAKAYSVGMVPSLVEGEQDVEAFVLLADAADGQVAISCTANLEQGVSDGYFVSFMVRMEDLAEVGALMGSLDFSGKPTQAEAYAAQDEAEEATKH